MGHFEGDDVTALATAPAPTRAGGPTSLNHIFCCEPDIALCGADISGDEIVDYDDADCVVCLDLEDKTCPRCGQ
jgi:hypothetical protein